MSEQERERVIDLTDPTDEKPVATYTVAAHCTNCEWRGKAEIPKGTPVKVGEGLQHLAKCPDCGCQTLVRSEAKKKRAKANPKARRADTRPAEDEQRRIFDEFRRRIDEERRSHPPVPITPMPYYPTPAPVTPVAPAPNPWQTPIGTPWVGDQPGIGIGRPYVGDLPNDQSTWQARNHINDSPRAIAHVEARPAPQMIADLHSAGLVSTRTALESLGLSDLVNEARNVSAQIDARQAMTGRMAMAAADAIYDKAPISPSY